jgi:anti-sigma B factor antagonist
MTATTTQRLLVAPATLGLDSRKEFRERAIALLEELPTGLGRLVVDLSGTTGVDSAGLGVLMLVQRRASERRQTVVLRGASDEIRFLLALTKLADLFEME